MLEFAHGEPPLSDMHPMRALFQIPYRKPPTLNKPSDWSRAFPDIIAKCLERDPRNRPDVTRLLQALIHKIFNLTAPAPIFPFVW